MMNNFSIRVRLFGLSLLAILGVCSCTEEKLVHETQVQEQGSKQQISFGDFPFSDKEELMLMSQEGVVNYEIVRKISMCELNVTGMATEMNWLNARLSELPITIYDLKSRPRYYDFIVYDLEGKPIGTVRTYARMEQSTVIQGVTNKITNYRALLTKTTSDSFDIFMDWLGTQYIGKRSQFGLPPNYVSDKDGNQIPINELHDLEGLEIVDYMVQNIFSPLVLTEQQKEEVFARVPKEIQERPALNSLIKASEQMNLSALRDSMVFSWEREQKGAEEFWSILGEHKEALQNMNGFNIAAEPEWLGRIFRRWFYPIDTERYYISRYNWEKKYRFDERPSDWCGPWACGLILYAKQHVDKYDYFVSCASSFGELGVGDFVLRILGRPLTPYEMSWSMPKASNGKIWINPSLIFMDRIAYDQIRYYDKPALRLCAVNGYYKKKRVRQLHWTLAYGAKQLGSWLHRNYYFMQIDNGSLVGIPYDPENDCNYTRVDWWNPWLIVWD